MSSHSAALFLADHLDLAEGARSAVLFCLMLGGVLGLLTTDRLLRSHEPLKVLRWACVACAISYACWLFAPGLVASALLLGATGFFGAALYPIVKARAYRALPRQSGMVNAVSHIFTPLEIALPLGLGLVADVFGLTAALVVLIAQPVGILVLASLPLAKEAQVS